MDYTITFRKAKEFIKYLENKRLFEGSTYPHEAKATILLNILGIKKEQYAETIYSNAYFSSAIRLKTFPSISELENYERSNSHEILISKLMELGELSRETINKVYKDSDEGSNYPIKAMYNAWKEKYIGSCDNESINNAVKMLKEEGYCVLPKILDVETCSSYLALIKEYAEREQKDGSGFFYGQNGTLQRIYHLSSKLSELNNLIVNPYVIGILDQMFYRNTWHDKYYLCSWHANIIPPGGEAQKVHIDVSIPDPIPPWLIRMNTNFLLQDYYKENGCTLIYPGSHKYLSRPTPEVLAQLNPVPIEAEAGSLVLWSGHVWHCSGNNQTSDKRIAVLGTYAASFLREMCTEEDNLRVHTIKGYPIDKKILDVMGVEHGIKDESLLTNILKRCKR